MNLKAGSNSPYVAGAFFAAGDMIVRLYGDIPKGGDKIKLKTGSTGWYVSGARFADGDSIVSVQFVTIIDCWAMPDGSMFYVINLGGSLYANADRLFADREEANAEAIRLQKLKIEKAKELLELHTRWLATLENR